MGTLIRTLRPIDSAACSFPTPGTLALVSDAAAAALVAAGLAELLEREVSESAYTAQSVLAAATAGSPAPVTLGEGTVLGRAAGGDVGALTAAQVMPVLGVASPIHLPMATGLYYAPGEVGSAGIPEEAEEQVGQFIPERDCTIDRLAVNMTVSGSTGATVRLGLREWNAATDRPGAVLFDSGAIDATVAASVLSATCEVAVTAGKKYALTCTVQGGATTRPTLTKSGARQGYFGLASVVANSVPNLYASGQTGSLAASPTWSLGTRTVARIWARTST